MSDSYRRGAVAVCSDDGFRREMMRRLGSTLLSRALGLLERNRRRLHRGRTGIAERPLAFGVDDAHKALSIPPGLGHSLPAREQNRALEAVLEPDSLRD
jgi:hypothetical protein